MTLLPTLIHLSVLILAKSSPITSLIKSQAFYFLSSIHLQLLLSWFSRITATGYLISVFTPIFFSFALHIVRKIILLKCKSHYMTYFASNLSARHTKALPNLALDLLTIQFHSSSPCTGHSKCNSLTSIYSFTSPSHVLTSLLHLGNSPHLLPG